MSTPNGNVGFFNGTMGAYNADFSSTGEPLAANGLQTNGELWIGSTALNAGFTHINVGNITSPLGTLTIGYSTPNITIDLAGSAMGVDSFGMQTGTSPVVPNGIGLVTFSGGTVASGTNPVRTDGTGPNTMVLEVQISQAIAATDATKIGLAAFDSTDFSVDANGFVALAGAGAGQTITGDSGGALSPTTGNWNILGLSGSKTSGSGSTLTVKSPPYADVGATGTSVLNSGEFVTGTYTRTLPLTAGLADGDLVEFICTTANILTITANTGQTIRLGSAVTAAAGTCVSTNIGDSISLRWSATATSWIATSSIGIWVLT